jgi:DNA-binding MarR family transcriptional regulator
MDDVLTVRDLCWKLNASKPAIIRALNRLSELDLVRRKADPLDRRSVLIQRTTAGAELLMSIKSILADTAKPARERTSAPFAG